MTAYDSENIVIGGTGQIRVAQLGAAWPTTFVNPTWPAGAVELGWTDSKGVVGNDQKTINDVDVWQSFYPAMKYILSRKFDFSFNLSEWTPDSFALAFGGGSWSQVPGASGASATARYDPPDPSTIDLRSLCLDWQSQGFNWRWVVYRGLVDSNVQTTIGRGGESLLPIQFSTLGRTGAPPWSVYTDNPRFLTTPPSVWTANTAYALNTEVTLGSGVVKAIVAGTSGAVAPTLPSAPGGTVTDGPITWERLQ